jgi:hypothetical protein
MLAECRQEPYAPAILHRRVSQAYAEIEEDLWLCEEQLARWRKGKLTAEQRREIETLAGELTQAAAMVDSVRSLAEELSEGSIDTVLAKKGSHDG